MAPRHLSALGAPSFIGWRARREGDPLRRVPDDYVWPAHSCPDLLRVVAFWLRFRRLCGSLPHASSHMWRLPWEKPKFTSSRLRTVFANTVSHLGVAPPEGRYWTLHCVRAGAASETSALGLSLPKIRAFGGWGLRSLVPERRYINPMCPASQSGHRFFGWMTASAALESSSH